MSEPNIIYSELSGNEIDQCRDLCNMLMAHQKAQATILPEVFDAMTFDTRMKASYQNALKAQVLVAKDGEKVVGYMFSSIEEVTDKDINPTPDRLPPWANLIKPKDGEVLLGFYPGWLTPQKIGHPNNLYVLEEYRKYGVGKKLFEDGLKWLESDPEVEHLFIHVSNGNEVVMKLYERYGFVYTHEVFGGFIKAMHKKVDK